MATAYCYRHPDRETGLSCSVCERPICTDCATFAAVGIRCPDHSGQPQGAARVAQRARRPSIAAGDTALVTKILIGLNVLVYLITVAQGAGINSPGGHLFNSWALVIRGTEFTATGQHLVGVAEGEWWRLITASFLHASLLHLGFNMLGLWWFGAPVEAVLGRARFLLLYVVSGLAGSAGALIASPHGVTVGASGALFGLLGAAVVLERFGLFVFGGSAVAIIVINLAFTLLVPGVSIGGHLGGLIGGALGAYALLRLGRVESMYGRVGMAGYAGLAAVGLLSVLVAVLQVSRYA